VTADRRPGKTTDDRERRPTTGKDDRRPGTGDRLIISLPRRSSGLRSSVVRSAVVGRLFPVVGRLPAIRLVGK
jgi:hypothetical protein